MTLLKVATAAVLAMAAMARGEPAATATSLLTQLPNCAVECITSNVLDTPCSITNITCLCSSQSFRADVTACVKSKCTVKQALVTMNVTETGCNAPVRDDSQKHRTVSDVLGIITGIIIILRMGYKVYAKMPFYIEDWITLVTATLGAPCTVINAYGATDNGLGRDVWTLTFGQITSFGRFFFILEIIYFAEVALLKMALLFFYLRVFPGRWTRRLLWATTIFSGLYGATFVMVGVFQCTPVNYFWNMWDEEHQGHCLSINAIGWSNAAISIALDVWMLALPLWSIRSLSLCWRKKLAVSVMFCLGTFVTVISILRLKSLLKFRSNSLNPTWDFSEVSLWSDIELNVGLICICLPSLRQLLVHLSSRCMKLSQQEYMRHISPVQREPIPVSEKPKYDLTKPLPPIPTSSPRRFVYLKPIYLGNSGDLRLEVAGALNTMSTISERESLHVESQSGSISDA